MTKEITMPRLSETMTDGKILSWNKKINDRVDKGEIIAEVETDKANMEIEAVDSGVISEILVPAGQKAAVGEPIAILNGKKTTPQVPEAKTEEIKKGKEELRENLEEQPEKPEKKEETPKPEKVKQVGIKASPVAKRLAAKENIDLSKVKGTGPEGRIRENDVLEYLEKPESHREEKEGKNIQPLSRMKQTIASRMSESKREIPHFYVTDEVNVDRLADLSNDLEKANKNITYNDIFIKAVSMALKNFPMLNSSFKGDYIEIKENINIGMAFATKDGLLVPVVHDCDKKSLEEISAETKIIKDRVKNDKLKPENITGGTFTISNMGMFNVKEFAAIINPPEAAGLAIGSIMKTPVVKNDQIVIGNTVNITLSADHRVVNGAEAATFLRDLKDNLENPDKIS
jgi:pyruvate dehydrogenase E2 component (dihydrolipoamide acetyltransferase)